MCPDHLGGQWGAQECPDHLVEQWGAQECVDQVILVSLLPQIKFEILDCH